MEGDAEGVGIGGAELGNHFTESFCDVEIGPEFAERGGIERGHVDGIANLAGGTEVADLLGDLDAHIFLGFVGGSAEVWSEGDVLFEAEERVIGGGGLFFEDVESATGDVAGVDGFFEGHFIDEAAAGAVDDEGALIHEADALLVEDVLGVGSHGDVQGDDVGSGEGLVRGGGEADLHLVGAGLGEEGVEGDDLHVKGLGTLGELGADATHADDGEGFAVELDALIGFAGDLEISGDDAGVTESDIASSGAHESEGMLGGRDGVPGGSVHHDDAV